MTPSTKLKRCGMVASAVVDGYPRYFQELPMRKLTTFFARVTSHERLLTVAGLILVSSATLNAQATINQISLEKGIDDENRLSEPVLDAFETGPLAVGAFTASYDKRALFVRRVGGNIFSRGPEYRLSPVVDVAALFTEAVRTEAEAIGFDVATSVESGWRLTGTIRDVYLESRQIYFGATLFYGWLDVELQLEQLGGNVATTVPMRLYHYYAAYNAGMGRRDEAESAAAHLFIEGAQELLARLNRNYFKAPPHVSIDGKLAVIRTAGTVEDHHQWLRAIGLSGHTDAIPVLLAILPTENDEDDRQKIIDALASLGSSEVIEILASRYAREEEDCRWHTLKAMDYIGSDAAAVVVSTYGLADDDLAPRHLATRIMAQRRSDPPPGAAATTNTIESNDRRRPVRTRRDLETRADRGDAEAQFMLGAMYAAGIVVDQNAVEAAQWFRRSAEQGYVLSMLPLARAYWDGQGVPQDFVSAHLWFNVAASQLAGEDRMVAVEGRDQVQAEMSQSQVTEAQRLARQHSETAVARPRIASVTPATRPAAAVDQQGPIAVARPRTAVRWPNIKRWCANSESSTWGGNVSYCRDFFGQPQVIPGGRTGTRRNRLSATDLRLQAIEQLLTSFGRTGGTDDMDLLVVHLNDQTTEALFNEPQKYVLRTQARNQTMFFVKGTALRDVTLDLDFLVNERQGSLEGWARAGNGTELAEGDEFLGVLTIDKLIPTGTTMVVTSGPMRFAFEFTALGRPLPADVF